MTESDAANLDMMRSRLDRDGYLFLRDYLDASAVLEVGSQACLGQTQTCSPPPCINLHMVQARRAILDELAAWKPSALKCKAKHVGLIQRQDLATSPALLRVLECRQLFQLMSDLLVSISHVS